MYVIKIMSDNGAPYTVHPSRVSSRLVLCMLHILRLVALATAASDVKPSHWTMGD